MQLILNWQRVSSSVPLNTSGYATNAISYDGKLWCLAPPFNSTGRVISSTNGVSWSVVTDSAPWGSNRSLNVIASTRHGVMVVVMSYWNGFSFDKYVWYSTNGSTWNLWTSSPAFLGRNYGCLVDAGTSCMVLMAGSGVGGALSDVWISTNGATWTQTNASAPWVQEIIVLAFISIINYGFSEDWVLHG